MKKLLLVTFLSFIAFSCKEEVKEAPKAEDEVAVETEEVAKEEPVKKDYKIKSITRKDFFAENKFGEFIQGDQINSVIRKYNEDGLPYEIEIGIIDPSQAKVAGDTLSKSKENDQISTFSYKPKKNGDNVEMYTMEGDLVEVLVMKDDMMYGYNVGEKEEPFAIRKFDEIGNYEYQIINTGDDYLYATVHEIVEKDENGFAKKSNAVWMQLKKRKDIDYTKLDINSLDVVEKKYQVVEFDYEVYN